ncbi:MAG: hypothetical protein QXQ57_04740 [Sulfolobales archaeon]
MFANLSRDEIAVLALIAGLADERRIFNRGRDAKKLTKLVFLASYAEEMDNDIRLRGNLRLGLRFHVYLYSDGSPPLMGEGSTPTEATIISLEPLTGAASSQWLRIRRQLRAVRGSYRYITGDELEDFVNGLLGIRGPEIKALVYGAEVQKLIEAREYVRKLEEKRKRI